MADFGERLPGIELGQFVPGNSSESMDELHRILANQAMHAEYDQVLLHEIQITLPDPETMDILQRQYDEHRYTPIPGLVAHEGAGQLLESVQRARKRWVSDDREKLRWEERVFATGDPALEFFRRPELLGLAQRLASFKGLSGLHSWSASYGQGAFLGPHRDKSGTTQLLICLQSPENPDNGGALVVNGEPLFLQSGDAVLFEATSLEHYTTPLISTPDMPNPKRIILVGRYFLE